MKKYLLAFVFPFLLNSPHFAQTAWQQINSGVSTYLREITFISDDIGWIVGHSGTVLKTTDGGNSWTIQNSTTTKDLYSVSFINDQIGWACGIDGTVIKTTNGGDTWTYNQVGTDQFLSISFVNESLGIALTGLTTPFRFSNILRTTNGGSSWNTVQYYNGLTLIDLYQESEKAWAVGTNSHIFKTSDFGQTWEYFPAPSGQWLHDVFFIDKYTGWAVGGNESSEIIVKTANGGITWNILRESFQYKKLTGVFFINSNQGWAVGSEGVILVTSDGGSTWTQQISGTNLYLRKVVFTSPETGFICGENGIILKYSNNSTGINIIHPNGGEVLTSGSTFNIEWNSEQVIAVKILFSSNSGNTWEIVVDSMISSGIYSWTVPNIISNQCKIKIADITDDQIFDISNNNFTIQSSKSINILTPNGGEIFEGGSITNVTWASNNVINVMIEYSLNNGASWNMIVDNWASTGIYEWLVPNIPSNQARIKISDVDLPSVSDMSDSKFTIIRITPVELISFTAKVNGNVVNLNWSTATELNNSGFEVQRKAGDEFIILGFVGGSGNSTEIQNYCFTDSKISVGNYSYRLKQIDLDGSFEYSSVVNVDLMSSAVFELDQNYPNPFNPSTLISYSIPHSSFVTLKVYNILGAKVATLINEEKSPGVYEVNFDGAALPSGTYIYKLSAGSFTETKKMVLLK